MGLLKYLSNAVVTADRYIDNLVEGREHPWDDAYQSMKFEHLRDYESNPEAAALYLEACRKDRIAEASRQIGDWAAGMVRSLKKGFFEDKISKAALDDLLDRVEKVRSRMLEFVKKSGGDAFEDNDALAIQGLCEKQGLRWAELPV